MSSAPPSARSTQGAGSAGKEAAAAPRRAGFKRASCVKPCSLMVCAARASILATSKGPVKAIEA